MNSRTDESKDTRERILATARRIMVGKGFAAVGLNEILTAAGVPKGSFYHYFNSKDAFGEALLDSYFDEAWSALDATLQAPGLNAAQRLLNYCQLWEAGQLCGDYQGTCLTVKLGAEVADVSEAMRHALERGVSGLIARLAAAIEAGVADGSVRVEEPAAQVAQSLYQLWLGASVAVKIFRSPQPFSNALAATRVMLGLSEPVAA